MIFKISRRKSKRVAIGQGWSFPHKVCYIVWLILLTGVSCLSCQNFRQSHLESNDAKSENDILDTVDTISVSTIFVSLSAGQKKFDLTSIADYKGIVSLEANDKCRISNLHRVYALDNGFIVWDNKRNAVFSFSSTGSFICQIGRPGRASGEYISLKDVQVDFQNKLIFLLDNDSHKLLCYDASGTFQREIEIKEWALGFCIDGDYIWLESDGMNKTSSILLKTDATSGRIVKSFFPVINDGSMPVLSEKTLNVNAAGEYIFASPYLNTIFQLRNGVLYPMYKVKFDGRTLDDSDLTLKSYVSGMMSSNYYGHLHDLYKVGNYLFFSFMKYNGQEVENSHSTLYDVERGDVHVHDFYRDERFPISLGTGPKGMGLGEVIFSIDPSSMPEKIISELRGVAGLENCSEDSNPVLIVYRICE